MAGIATTDFNLSQNETVQVPPIGSRSGTMRLLSVTLSAGNANAIGETRRVASSQPCPIPNGCRGIGVTYRVNDVGGAADNRTWFQLEARVGDAATGLFIPILATVPVTEAETPALVNIITVAGWMNEDGSGGPRLYESGAVVVWQTPFNKNTDIVTLIIAAPWNTPPVYRGTGIPPSLLQAVRAAFIVHAPTTANAAVAGVAEIFAVG
jgi:hypothetical protein